MSLPTEEAARNRLIEVRWPQGVICSKCGSQKVGQKTKRETFSCRNCRYQISATSGSFMHSTNLPVLLWFLAGEEYIKRQATGRANMLTNAKFGAFLRRKSNDTVVRVKKALKTDLELGPSGLLIACICVAPEMTVREKRPTRDDYEALIAAVNERNFASFRR